MSFIQREIDRIRAAIHNNRTGPNHDRLYAAMQALEWAKDPDNVQSPYNTITGDFYEGYPVAQALSQMMRDDMAEDPNDRGETRHG